jgi:hypothetical protein
MSCSPAMGSRKGSRSSPFRIFMISSGGRYS